MKDILVLTLLYTVACLIVLLEVVMVCTIILIPLLLALRDMYGLFGSPFTKMFWVWHDSTLRK